MKKIIVALMILSVYACSSSKNVVDSTEKSNKTEVFKDGNDGSSIEKAIVVKARNEQDGVRSEYVLLGKMHPNFRLKSQGTSSKGSSQYDIMTIVLDDGTEKVVYFDITSFYGKF